MGRAQLPHGTTLQPKREFPYDGCRDIILRILLSARDVLIIFGSCRTKEEKLEIREEIRDMVQKVG